MAASPKVFNLIWRNHSAQHRPPREPSQMHATTEHINVVDDRPDIPAVILFPALMTPALHVRGKNRGMFEILVAAPKSPALTADQVAQHLTVLVGLDPGEAVPERALCLNANGRITVHAVTPDEHGQLKTGACFRGILHKTVKNWLPKELDAFYAIRIHESCLPQQPDAGTASRAVPVNYQNSCIQDVLTKLNGKALRGEGGRGTHEFVLGDDGVDYTQVDLERPIVAYHPLYVYPTGALREVTYGHVSDLHINARQRLLQRSPARVIDAMGAQKDSPVLGPMVSVFESSFQSILTKMHDEVDALLVGGDVIEHVDNTYPYGEASHAARLADPNAADIWSMVDVDKGYVRNHQAYVDLIAFFTAIRHFCEKKPAFVVSGNHDCYKASRLYGISPRVFGGPKGNPGIPADHNLTFYEAILLFGESWSKVSVWPFMSEQHLEWFFAVLTPFSDFRVELPTQNLVGLQWGGEEDRISLDWGYKAGGQGPVHLGRASQAVSEDQLALLRADAATKGKTVLMTHFTLVSYSDELAVDQAPVHGYVEVGGEALPGKQIARGRKPYSEYDLGTCEKARAELYAFAEDRGRCAAVMTGHSHRKGLYFLGKRAGATRYPTEAHALRSETGYVADAAAKVRDAPPILVSDSSGPLPRLNLKGEFKGWGSDAPSGTLVTVSRDGTVTKIQVVPSSAPNAKPRLAVALDYLLVHKHRAFAEILARPFDREHVGGAAYQLSITFHAEFPDEVADCLHVILYGRPSVDHGWHKIVLQRSATSFKVRTESRHAELTLDVPEGQAQEFYEWLTVTPLSGRFISFGFKGVTSFDQIYDKESRWNFAVSARAMQVPMHPWLPISRSSEVYQIVPREDDWKLPIGAADFAWRRRTKPAVYGDRRR